MSESNRILVIGSGPAGAAAALFASKVSGVETLMLEAGPARRSLGFTLRIKGLTVAKQRPALRCRDDLTLAGDPSTVIYEEIAPGGLSNHWSCAVPRFSESDFEDGVRAGPEYTWPIGYADISPWYDQVEPLLNIAGSDAATPQLPAGRVAVPLRLGEDWDEVARAAQEDGRSVVPMPYAYGASTFFTRSGTSCNVFTRMIAPAVRRGAFTFRGDTRVTKLEWSTKERRVVAALAVDAAGRESRIPCRAVIVAAGAINSARILLESTSADFPHGLGNEHGVLGLYLHDHPLAKLVIDLGRPVSVSKAAYITRPRLEGTAPLQTAAFMQWMRTSTIARTFVAGHPGRATQLGFTVFGTMVPRPEDYVARDESDAPGALHPKLTLSLRHPPEVGVLLEQARRELLSMFERAGWEPRERVWKVEPPGASVHYGGTCRMHALPRYGVVDGWCRVHGISNVAVADSGVFTTSPEKNPVLTAMAIAARAGDRLGQQIVGGDL